MFLKLKRSSWALILGMSGLIILFWFVAGGVALRYLVLFIGVMSCMYVVWDVIGQCKICAMLIQKTKS